MTVAPLARRELRDGRTRLVIFGYLIAVYAYIQPVGYRHTYPTPSDREAFAASFGQNTGLRLLYGRPDRIATVAGYTGWRVGGVLALVTAAFGLLAAVRALRAEEEAGRTEYLLALPVTRRRLFGSALIAVAAGIAVLSSVEFGALAVAGVPASGAAYLAAAEASTAAVFAGIGALSSQLASTRRGALGLGYLVLAASFVLRIVADTVDGLGLLRWFTPLGWAELLRPFDTPRPEILLMAVMVTAGALGFAARLSAGRDLGVGLVPGRDTAAPRRQLLGSAFGQALRGQLSVLLGWALAIAGILFVLGVVSHGISSSDTPQNVQDELAKLNTGSIVTPAGYLSLLFLFVTIALAAFGCAQVGAARGEEDSGRLEILLAQPVRRDGWLAGRLLLAATAATVMAVIAGLFAWAGARTAGVAIGARGMVGAGLNCLPCAILFLGIAALAYAVWPRVGEVIGYALLSVSVVWQLVGSLLGPPRWVLDASPFAHVSAAPVQAVDVTGTAVLLSLGVLAGALAVVLIGRRDLG